MKFVKKDNKILDFLSAGVAIDLGTSNTLVYVKGKGIVFNEPTVVAVNKKTNQLVAVGKDAKIIQDRSPGHIEVIEPLVDGVVSDFEAAEEMLTFLISKVRQSVRTIISPRILVGVPSGVSNVEMRAVHDVVKNAGAREVFLVEEVMAAALGSKLPISKASASMIVDIGGGTADIAVISLNGLVSSKNVKNAGEHLNEAIISYVRYQFRIHIGKQTAERAKISLISTLADSSKEITVCGRDAASGLPREIVITDSDIYDAVSSYIVTLTDDIKSVMEETPPEVLADIMKKGIYLSGGGSLIPGLDDLLKKELQVPVHVVTDPIHTVIRGLGVMIEDLSNYQEFLIDYEKTFIT